MTVKKSKFLVMSLWFYIVTIFTKDYIVNLLIYMNESDQGLAYISLKSALIQAFVLILGGILFFIVKRKILNDDAVYNGNKDKKTLVSVAKINRISLKQILLGFISGIVSYIAFNSLKSAYIMIRIYINGEVNTGTAPIDIETGMLFYITFIFAILMVIGEELVYRSMLFSESIYTGGRIILFLIINSLIFASAHDSVDQIIQAVFLSIILCLSLLKTGSLTSCILIHFTYNVIGLFVTYLRPTLMLELTGYRYGMLNIDILISTVAFLILFIAASVILLFLTKSDRFQGDKFDMIKDVRVHTPAVFVPALIILVYSACRIIKVFSRSITTL